MVPFVFLIWEAKVHSQVVYTIETIPDPKQLGGGYISDPDGLLNTTDATTLNSMIAGLEQTSTAQIAIVMVGSIGQENPKDFATRLFNHWGIGQASTDNGLLILSVMDQRRTEFETGYGLEGVLPDIYCYRIGMQKLVPHFKEGNYGTGLISAVEEIKRILEDPAAIEEIRAETEGSKGPLHWWKLPPALQWYIIAAVLFHLGLFVWILLTLSGKDELYDKYVHIRYVYSFIFIILFPVPYLIFYFYLQYLLKRLRNYPRFSKVNGKPMHKLSESDDDSFLKEGQVTEEEIGAIDYDVWVTDNHDDVLILRYANRFSKYSECPQCRFKTYYLAHSQTLQHPSYSHSGHGVHIHECKNCNYEKRTTFILPQKTRSSSGGGGGGGGGSWGGGSSGGGGGGVSW